MEINHVMLIPRLLAKVQQSLFTFTHPIAFYQCMKISGVGLKHGSYKNTQSFKNFLPC